MLIGLLKRVAVMVALFLILWYINYRDIVGLLSHILHIRS